MKRIHEILMKILGLLERSTLPSQEYFTLSEAASYLRTSETTIKNLHRDKQIDYFLIGGERRYRKIDLDHFAEKKIKKAFLPESTKNFKLKKKLFIMKK